MKQKRPISEMLPVALALVDSLRQVSRCVYGSCGCRMWQGRVPDTWKE